MAFKYRNIHENISTDNNVGEFRFHNLHRIAKSFVRGWLYYVYVIHIESECTIALTNSGSVRMNTSKSFYYTNK